MQSKSQTKIINYESKIEGLEKDIALYEKELRAISHTLDDYNDDDRAIVDETE